MTSQNSSTQIDPDILRASDIRGIVGKNLNETVIQKIGLAFGTIARRRGLKKLAVGMDGRLSSPALEKALINGLMEVGIDVHCIGTGPSPMLYFATYHLECDGGLMITGSHNPPDYNGIKMMLAGQSFHGEEIQKLGALIEKQDFDRAKGSVSKVDVSEAYITRLLQELPDMGDMRIAWDAGNGAAGDIMSRLTERLPGQHFLLNETIDGTFPAHHPDPTVEENLTQLKETVQAKECDLGIAFDGDGDRIGIIDRKGRPVWGDQLMILFAREILREVPGATIIGDVKCSQTFFDEIDRLGGKAIMWKSGHAMIKSKMVETGALLAGEMSAHIFFKHGYYGFDDALYAAVRLIGILAKSEDSLDQSLDQLPKSICTPEIRFACPEDRKFKIVEDIAAKLDQQDGVSVCTIDGVRVDGPDGWWLLRASNTQAVLVARCESATNEGLKHLVSKLENLLKDAGVSLPEIILPQ